MLCQEPTGDGRVQNKFTGLLPYACHKFLCAYVGLSLRARSHGLSPSTTSTTHATFIRNKRKIEPIQSALNRKKKKQKKREEEAARCCSGTAFSATNRPCYGGKC